MAAMQGIYFPITPCQKAFLRDCCQKELVKVTSEEKY